MKKIIEPGIAKEGFIPLCVPYLSGNEWKYIKECLDTNWVSSAGPYVDKFEKEIVNYLGSKFAVACVNGTAALHISLLILGIKQNDEVITSDLTFVAPANAIRYVGAYPVFIDADYLTFQIDISKLKDFLKTKCKRTKMGLLNKETKRIIRAILPVHILGHCCNIKEIISLSEEYGLPVIEDATEALGARFNGKYAGTYGKIGVFSFNGNKIITTGGGGMLVTDDANLAEKAKYLTTQAKDDSIEFIHKEIGYNYRLPNILAAMGVAQLENLEMYIRKKRKIANFYNKNLIRISGFEPMIEPENCESTFWLYTAKVNKKKYGLNRRELMIEFSKRGIETRPLWQPMHLLKPHSMSYSYKCENSVKLKDVSISLPCSTNLKRKDQKEILNIIERVGKK
ncbi:MAG: LegC family aminotransferase [Acidobacteria bacterium]|nr:LegC family aminotransferase [Acidobacteriota bacterium]